MKVFTVLLLATLALGHQTQESEWRQFYKFAVGKAMESCLGKDTVNKYTVNMKKAVAKCQQQEAPELDIPPYRSMYKFVNTIIKSADQMDQYKLNQMFNIMRLMTNVHDNEDYNKNYNSGSNWIQEQFMKYKMHQMMKEIMYDDQHHSDYKVRPYSFDHKDNKMGKFEKMKLMKDIMSQNRYSDNFEMKKMMKKFFGNHHSNDEYEMMEKFFKNDNQMDAFEMMKMMMKFSGDEKNMDMSQMMQSMEKMYGNDFQMTEQDYNKYDMMNMKTEQQEYSPPQARYRFKRQVYKPLGSKQDYTKPTQGLDRGDRLFAKLQEQKKEHEEYIGNMTCVLRENKILNKENEIDVQSLKKSMEQYSLPSPWFKNRFEELIDICYETATNLPASIVDEQEVEGEFGKVNVGQVKTFIKCCREGKQKLCMNQDTKNKIEANFGPIKSILKETKLTEYQLFPLVQEMLQGEESEYLGLL